MRKVLDLLPDGFTLAIVATVAFASFLPCYGEGATIFHWLTTIAIAIMFFMQGARLSREAIIAGIGHWRLHLTILASTFVLFPVLGFGFEALFPHAISHATLIGLLYICLLPSTVQSSIAFTSIAHGNVPAAICSATFSTLLGVIVTPIMASLLLRTHGGGGGLESIGSIFLELLLPFVLGQLLRPWIGGWANRNKHILKFTDRGSIILVVYTAFSGAVIDGLWHKLPLSGFAEIIVANAVLLAVVLVITTFGSRLLGFGKAEEIAIVFCGSKKSAATGVPMANVLFGASTVGLIVLPLIIFHQMQLMVCAVLAKRYARQHEAALAAHGAPAPAE
ncbi:MAG TPA: bile acid:sodium symporter family protein [Acidisoma sp.]|jgi:sodium/bile acid cotransporter 7|uniref:bile acid:sodium symporter family protein n=1 Tax=Acidisoma sp. TaxID=1872115 RepID=UPI002C97230F|nr:bile acid:sodium symporter family protein [Acidisoma sp.]HTI00998.1 bile acid:sodium symporter family protein [Acidisoma sp.]